MLRLLFLVLLLANMLFFAWSQGMLAVLGFAPASQSEPQRANHQIRPELVRTFPVGSSASPGAPAPAAAPVASPPLVATSASQGVAPGNSSASVATTACLQAGPFDAAQTERLRRALETWPLQAWQLDAVAQPGRWLVYMGKYPSAAAAAAKRAELRTLGVTPAALDDAALEPGISLGDFDSAEQASERLAELTRQGVRTARVLAQPTPAPASVLKLPQVDDSLRPRLDALRPALAGQVLGACPA